MKLLLNFLILFPALLLAQNELTVNSFTDSTQRDARIDRLASGNYVACWVSSEQAGTGSETDIYMRYFDAFDNPVGPEFLVNSHTAGSQDKPAISTNAADNRSVVCWVSKADFESIHDIRAAIIQDGNVLSDSDLVINSTTQFTQSNPDVAILNNDHFVVCWDSWYQDGSDRGVYARIFNSQGVAVSDEIQLNTTTQFSQARPLVRLLSNGNLLFIWESWKQDTATPNGYGLIGRIFDQSGIAQSEEFAINSYVNDFQWFADATALSDNSFVVAWCSWEQDGDDGGIFMRKFSNSGQALTPEVAVNKTTAFYQWLPKIKSFANDQLAVVWSSWKQDGSREGIYTRYFTNNLRPLTFETQVNQTTENFQWEPDFEVSVDNEIRVLWSSWQGIGPDYDIIQRRMTPQFVEGFLGPRVNSHFAGRSTTTVTVHVTDSTSLSGAEYEIGFSNTASDSPLVEITNLSTTNSVVSDFPLAQGENHFYLTPEFDGLRVEINPEFDLKPDFVGSYFINHSGTNIIFDILLPEAGVPKLAPIDVWLIWGDQDTLSDGRYAFPQDTAYGIDAVRNIELPFRAWNPIDSAKVELLVVDQDVRQNGRWDAGERIIILTPEPFRQAFGNSHLQVNTTFDASTMALPAPGDTNIILTTRPLTGQDRFRFTADNSAILTGLPGKSDLPVRFELHQNYPNPFNPTTTIKYYLPKKGHVKGTVYNVLGQKIKVLENGIRQSGLHKVLFDGNELASGVYFYVFEADQQTMARKMLLVK